MTSQQHEDIRTRMHEAVLLPTEHPLRQAVVEGVAIADGDLEREWLELVQEDERLRVELARVTPPPPDLHRRLLDIPAQTRPNLLWDRPKTWTVALVVSVLVVIILFLAFMLTLSR